jgi:hypothetical protein
VCARPRPGPWVERPSAADLLSCGRPPSRNMRTPSGAISLICEASQVIGQDAAERLPGCVVWAARQTCPQHVAAAPACMQQNLAARGASSRPGRRACSQRAGRSSRRRRRPARRRRSAPRGPAAPPAARAAARPTAATGPRAPRCALPRAARCGGCSCSSGAQARAARPPPSAAQLRAGLADAARRSLCAALPRAAWRAACSRVLGGGGMRAEASSSAAASDEGGGYWCCRAPVLAR